MTTLGHSFVPPSVPAGGLRYHGMAPLISYLYQLKLIKAQAAHQTAVFKSAITFARSEGYYTCSRNISCYKSIN